MLQGYDGCVATPGLASLSDPLKNEGDALPDADAQAHHSVAAAPSFQFPGRGEHKAGAGGAEGVANGNGAAVGIHPRLDTAYRAGQDARHRLHAGLLAGGGRSNHQRGGAIVDPGGVAAILVRHAREGETGLNCRQWERVLPEIEYRPGGG